MSAGATRPRRGSRSAMAPSHRENGRQARERRHRSRTMDMASPQAIPDDLLINAADEIRIRQHQILADANLVGGIDQEIVRDRLWGCHVHRPAPMPALARLPSVFAVTWRHCRATAAPRPRRAGGHLSAAWSVPNRSYRRSRRWT